MTILKYNKKYEFMHIQRKKIFTKFEKYGLKNNYYCLILHKIINNYIKIYLDRLIKLLYKISLKTF